MPPNPRPSHWQSLPREIPRLCAIVDAEVCARVGRSVEDVARAFLAAGAKWIQLRGKAIASGRFLDLASAILVDCRLAGTTLVINDRADIAALAGAHGVHVGQTDLSPGDARRVIGTASILGLSTHTKEQWEAAVREPISYMAIGPVFGTRTKETGHRPVGLDVVREASAAATAHGLPLVSIGGITVENARTVIDAGSGSVAVISDLVNGDPETRCRAFLRILQ